MTAEDKGSAERSHSLHAKGVAAVSREAKGKAPGVVPMSRERPNPMERKPWRFSSNTSPDPRSVAVEKRRAKLTLRRPGSTSDHNTGSKILQGASESGTAPPEDKDCRELEELSRLPTNGPLVSVNQEIRSLFDRAIGSAEDCGPDGNVPQTTTSAPGGCEVDEEVPMQEPSFGAGMQECSPEQDLQCEPDLLERELAATEAHALKLTMQKEARRQQAEAQKRVTEYEKGLQAELEAKVMGLMDEKDAKVAEAEALRRDLDKRIHELQAMVNQLDHKIVQHSESYEVILCELKNEYQHLVSQFRAKLEDENKAKLMEFMADVRRQREAQYNRSPLR